VDPLFTTFLELALWNLSVADAAAENLSFSAFPVLPSVLWNWSAVTSSKESRTISCVRGEVLESCAGRVVVVVMVGMGDNS
jgi:hypothetical protein